MRWDHRQDLRFGALILSLSFHGLFILGLLQAPFKLTAPKGEVVPLEVQWVETPRPEESRRLVVDTPEVQEPPLPPEDLARAMLKEARHLSRLSQRVREELSAPLHPPPSRPRPRAEDSSPSGDQRLRFAGEARFSTSVGEFVPGLQEGHFTALNTDQFLYYSFFKRINEQIRNRWVPRLRQATQTLPADLAGSPRAQRLVSEIEVLLSPEGELEEITLLRSSGLRQVDLAAVHAIHNSAPFKNPPEEMVKEDGYIRLSYQFVLIFSPVLAIGP